MGYLNERAKYMWLVKVGQLGLRNTWIPWGLLFRSLLTNCFLKPNLGGRHLAEPRDEA